MAHKVRFVALLSFVLFLALCLPAGRARSEGMDSVPPAPAPAQASISFGMAQVGSPARDVQSSRCAPPPSGLDANAQTITNTRYGLDMVLVLDQSGSMQEDAYCFRDNNGNPCYIRGDSTYPAGERLYVPYATWITTPLTPPLTYEGYEILAAEAEYFSYSTSFSEHPYDRDLYVYPGTFWMIQRVQNSQASGYSYNWNDRRGVHLMHMPHRDDLPGHSSVTAAAPRLDYHFTLPDTAPVTSTWYVWIRAQCGYYPGNSSRTDSCITHWGVDGTWRSGESTEYSDFERRGGDGYGSDGYNWRWVRLGSFEQTGGDVQINIWGGGTGFRLDKVLITRHPGGPDTGYTDRAPAFIRATTPSWESVRGSSLYQTYVYNSRYGGPADTGGRDGMAGDECSPIYGLRVNPGCTPGQSPTAGCRDLDGSGVVDADEICDHTLDDIYDDEYPIRAAKIAATNLVKRFNARFDQLGFVAYQSDVEMGVNGRELNCVRRPGSRTMPDFPGVWDPDTGPDIAWTWCYDHRTGTGGYTGSQDDDLVDGSILGAIESMDATGWTNLAQGMKTGIEVLSMQPGHYGRPCAVSVMVLMSDGIANRWPGFSSCGVGTCCEQDLYQPNSGNSGENRAADCAIYYARQARDNHIIVYTVGLHPGPGHELLRAIAQETGGEYYGTPSAQNLDAIMATIADHSLAIEQGVDLDVRLDTPSVQPGKPLTYTLTVTNTGDLDLHAAITSTLSEGTAPSGVLAWTATIPAPGGVWTETVVVVVDEGYTGPLTHMVEVMTEECPRSLKTVSLVRDIGVSQHVPSGPVQPWSVLTYRLEVTNTGSVDLHAAITDTLPLHASPGGVLTWTQVTIAPGQTWVQEVPIFVDGSHPEPLVNTLQVTTDEGVAGASVSERSLAFVSDLEMSADASFVALRPGGPLTYTLAVTNTGDVALHATITSTLPEGVTPAGPLVWTPTIPAPGGVWSETVVVTVDEDYIGPLLHLVEVTAAEGPHDSRSVSLVRGIEAGQRFAPNPVQPGGTLTYTLSVTNTGNVDLHATIFDILPAHASPSGVWAWPPAVLAPGEVWVRTLAVTVDADYRGPLTNTLQVATEEGVTDTAAETALSAGGWWQIYLPLLARMLR